MEENFTNAAKTLFERADKIEGIEGTVKLSYTELPEDAQNVRKGSNKKLIFLTSLWGILAVVYFVIFLITDDNTIKTAMLVAAVFFFVAAAFMLFTVLGNRKNIARHEPDEVKLAFNVYGLTVRAASGKLYSVYAFEWNDFDNIVEYDRIIVGLRGGLAYMFPKRVMTENEYNLFRKFSFDAIGKKCIYKNYKG